MKEITIEEWMAAEKEYANRQSETQPKGSVTTEQYAKMRGLGESRSQRILCNLYKAGLVRRERWKSGVSGTRYIYFLKKK